MSGRSFSCCYERTDSCSNERTGSCVDDVDANDSDCKALHSIAEHPLSAAPGAAPGAALSPALSATLIATLSATLSDNMSNMEVSAFAYLTRCACSRALLFIRFT